MHSAISKLRIALYARSVKQSQISDLEPLVAYRQLGASYSASVFELRKARTGHGAERVTLSATLP